jgi:adenylate cyclase
MRIRRPSSATVLACTFALLAAAWGSFLGARQVAGVGSALDRFEYLTVDLRFLAVGAQPAPRGVVIAAIDDETIREAGGYPLPRGVLARIVRGLALLGPQAVAVDVLFIDPDRSGSDLELANALNSTRSVVAAIGLFERDQSPAGRGTRFQPDQMSLVPNPSSLVWPTAVIHDSVRSGLVNVATDHAGVPRYIPMIYRAGDSVIPSFALAASSAALNTEPVFGDATLKLAARTVRLDLGYHLPVRYYGPHGTVRQFSAVRILRGDLDPNEVRGQVVVLGATAVGLGDTFATPFDRVMPGVEVWATAISNIFAGDGLVKTNFIRMTDAVTAILLPAATILLMAIPRPLMGFGLAGLVLALWSAFTVMMFVEGYWLSVAVPVAAVVPATASYGVARLLLDRFAVRRLTSETAALSKFQSPGMVEHILKNPQFLEKPVHQNVAVVFLDLSGFTEIAEALGPHWARELLAAFHALVESDVVAHDGFIVSFMGDGAMIIFGLPEPSPDDASRALLTVMQLHESIAAWLRALPPVARERMSVRIAGHCGPAVVSRLGPAHHQHITATGDTVNVTSRLLEVAKQERSSLVVSQDLYAAAGSTGSFGHQSTADLAREVSIRGRKEPLRIRILN